jgi:hypothetical protein
MTLEPSSKTRLRKRGTNTIQETVSKKHSMMIRTYYTSHFMSIRMEGFIQGVKKAICTSVALGTASESKSSSHRPTMRFYYD